ncbi:MAG: CDP-alcohol phosphatidyltransferase family protein [Ferrimicrobium sp.]
MFDGNFRTAVDRRTAPIGRVLSRVGVSADWLTAFGLVVSVAAGAVLVFGHLLIGLTLLVLGVLPDLLDGPVAKASQSSSKRGAFFDSVADRISDLALFGGLAWYFVRQNNTGFAVVAFGVYGLASLVSYQRAKAESLGFTAKGGLFERAERVAVLAVGLMAMPLLRPALIVILVGSAFTVVQRFVKVWRQASRQPDRIQAASRLTTLRKANRRRRGRAGVGRLLARRSELTRLSSRRRPRGFGGS